MSPVSKIKCKLISHSLSHHLSQIYTGFLLLAKRGLIELEQELSDDAIIDKTRVQHLQDARHAHLTVVLNDQLTIHYDTHDAIEVDEQYLQNCDIYFKRSFSESYIGKTLKYSNKIFPLGLNYKVLSNDVDWLAVKRVFGLNYKLNQKCAALFESLDIYNFIKATPRLKALEALPYNLPAKALFLVTAYDPYNNPERSEFKAEERAHINESRANCIRLLRRELGDKFFGGFQQTDFTVKHYKNLLVPDNRITRKGNYLKNLRSYPICIATTGLHDSIGWKFAEYVALSKAIVSEKLMFEVPGDFAKDKNYLEFTTPEECVTQSLTLMEDPQLRYQMMINNARYYQSNLKPDCLILNTLLKSLSLL